LLKATFPGGSITGAPKLKAIEIIRELEAEPRGPYCGTIGWLGVNGNLELNIAIRTALVDTAEGVAHFHAGSGIVADSDPEKEYEETLHKAQAFFAATNATFPPRE
jgi:para-aminobenzoate synthetase component 1